MSSSKKSKNNLNIGREEFSGLSSFVERPVPTEKEVASFDRAIKREVRELEMDSDLSEIYRDKKGSTVDVKQLNIRQRPPFWLRFFRQVFILAILVAVIYGGYQYWLNGSASVGDLDFKISAPESRLVGEAFSYRVEYHNPTNYPVSKVRLELQYPTNFIFDSASLAPASGNYGWDLPDLAPGGNFSLVINGQLIAQADSANVVLGRLSYVPSNLSTQFKKEASASTIISGLGFRADLDFSSTAFLDSDNDLTLIISDIQVNQLGDFNLSFVLPSGVEASVVNVASSSSLQASSTASGVTPGKVQITKSGGLSWRLSGLSPEAGRQEIPLSYKVKQRSADLELKVRLEKRLADGQLYVFWEKSIKPNIISSDLNLTLSLNGSKTEAAVNFGQPLNYSLTYANHGSNAYKDVVIMAGLSGSFLDWNSLQDSKNGAVHNNTIIWTKNEIPELAEVKPGAAGEINFSINLRLFKDSEQGQDLLVTAYGQYSMNNQPVKGQGNRSNEIKGLINSDLSLDEKILYFNEDNLPVGSGPLPPQVDNKTSFRVYWTVKNNLHELSDTRAVFDLPDYVAWENNSTTNVGNLYYDSTSHQVIWEIGRLPVSVYRVDAEFSLSLTPTASDKNKILVLSPGSALSAMDTETKSLISKRLGAKTTKLEDDDIAGLNNSGIIK
ncbi:MAG: hypothetical protein WC863_04450 [Patescibacteria group bacterium]